MLQTTTAISDSVHRLLSAIVALNRLQESFITGSLELLNDDEMQAFSKYVDYLHAAEHFDVSYMAQCYNTLVKDIFREQIYFARHGRYRYSTYDQVSGSVYMNSEYMKLYMYGLAISTFIWGQHIAMKRWFNDRIPKSRTGQYLEVGPGHGYHFMEALKYTSYDFFTGVDISPASVQMTANILDSGYFGSFKNFELKLADFLAMDASQTYDAVVMAEVLEHVEEPELFLRKLRAISKPDAFIYATTVINAPAIDHLTLFTSVADVERCVHRSGLQIDDRIVVGSNNRLSVEDHLKQRQPVNIAMVLSPLK